MKVFCYCIAALLCATSVHAAPPIYPPPIVRDVALELTRAFNARDLPSYARLFTDDVKVFYGGNAVARNKREWISRVANEFKTRNQRNEPLNIGLGLDTILIFEMSRDNPKGGLQEAIAGPRAASYTLRDGKISEVRFLGGASYLIDGKLR